MTCQVNDRFDAKDVAGYSFARVFLYSPADCCVRGLITRHTTPASTKSLIVKSPASSTRSVLLWPLVWLAHASSSTGHTLVGWLVLTIRSTVSGGSAA